MLCLALVLPAYAPPPLWWSENATRIVANPPVTPDNYGVANLGQLKHVAAMAKKHLDQHLATWGGAGSGVNAVVASFVQNTPDNFAPVNLGQLKAVAKPFYDRLREVGMNTNASLRANGYPASWPHDYPWDPTLPINQPTPPGATVDKTANLAPINLSQLKMAFSFDVAKDTDGDGIPDWWETKYGLNPNNPSDANATAAGGGMTNGQHYGQGSNPNQAPPPPPPPLLIGVPNDWQGWTRIGRSDDLGVYGSGSTSTSALYDVYANQFYLNAASGASSIPVGNQYVTGDPTGLFTYSPGAFTGEHRILGIGVEGVGSGANVSGFTPTVRFALGDNTYSAATNVEAGRTSFSLYSHSGDFTVQFQPVGVGGSSIYRPSNITFRGDDSFVYTLPGGIGSGASYDFAFRAIPLTSSNSYQMFFDLDAMQSLYSNVSLFQATFNRPNVMVAPGTNYYGQGIGTIGSTVTIALNGLSNNNVVFSVNAPPPPFRGVRFWSRRQKYEPRVRPAYADRFL
jgi:hypothetical protein